ncbi:MAG: hypothetical protein R3C99_10455 [Pirellulaceae bacterium]|nr:hypothetical protein [Planctomycetales bacterium]MCA9204411.1 hypothetical protein [Planctomycetales bacterium]MCA9220395.1 hypothetical protein [Planctomycetales bacterium]
MIRRHPDHSLKTYEVRVGHHCVVVQGSGRSDALQVARQRLANELPRLWDVIHTLDDERFDAREVSEQ